jgi:dipeptidyl aminopeptidase/acylaminoacyl peptidase
VLSPNGERLAILGAERFDTLSGQVMIWDKASEQLTPIEVDEDIYDSSSLSWDSTSTRLLFGDTANPAIYDVTSGIVEPLSVGSERFVAVWGPLDNQITKFVLKPAAQDPDQSRRVEILNLDDSSEAYLFDLDWGVAGTIDGRDWSPDGQQLLFSMWAPDLQSGNPDIYLFDRQTLEVQTLVATDANENNPHWSPDGKWFVYLADPSSAGVSELVFSSVDGECVIRNSVNALLMDVDWGPADQLAVVYSNALYLVDMPEAFGFGLEDLASHCGNQ